MEFPTNKQTVRSHTTVPKGDKRNTPCKILQLQIISTTDHLFVGEKMKKDEAGGIGSF